jgi:hypothetical protein
MMERSVPNQFDDLRKHKTAMSPQDVKIAAKRFRVGMTGVDHSSKDFAKHTELQIAKPILSFLIGDEAEHAEHEAHWDIDSVLALSDGLDLICADLKVDLDPNPVRNLCSSIHLSLGSRPIHSIPQIKFAEFTSETKRFDVFLLAPNIRHKNSKRKTGLVNVIPNVDVAAFMDKVWLPAIHKVLPPTELAPWPKSWQISNNKCKYPCQSSSSTMNGVPGEQVVFTCLASKYIPEVWKACKKILSNETRRPGLKGFKDLKFLVSGKDFKAFTASKSLGDVMNIVRGKVRLWCLTIVDSRFSRCSTGRR